MLPSTRWITYFTLTAILTGCGQASMSERDTRLEQMRLQAEAKRRELAIVAGDYSGELVPKEGAKQLVDLTLMIRDIPTPVEGSVDPVMVPTLVGQLTLDFSIFTAEKAEYEVSQEKVSLVLSNPQYKELIATLQKSDAVLEGTWSFPALKSSGTMRLERVVTKKTQEPQQ